MARDTAERSLIPNKFPTTAFSLSSVLLVGLTAIFVSFDAYGEFYRNQDYGFSFEIPDGIVRCTIDPGTNADGTPAFMSMDAGPGLFLDGAPGDCAELKNRPSAAVIATGNVLFEENIAEVIARECDRIETGMRKTRLPSDLAFKADFESRACRADRDDGWIDITVYTLGPTWPHPVLPPGSLLSRNNYAAHLHTRPERLDADLMRLRAVLDAVRFFKPDY